MKKWDKEATVGLIALLVAAVALLLLFSALLRGNGTATVSSAHAASGDVPQGATDIVLPADKLNDALSLVSPLLRAEVSAFDSPEEASDEQILTALLLHAVREENEGTYQEDWVLLECDEIDRRFASLLGRAPQLLSDTDGAVTRGDGIYCLDPSLALYYPDYLITAEGAQTLGNTFYVHFTVTAPIYETETESILEQQTVRKVVAALSYENETYSLLSLRDEAI